MRDTTKRASDAMRRGVRQGLDPYNSADVFGRVYEWKWHDDVRRTSEYAANRALVLTLIGNHKGK